MIKTIYAAEGDIIGTINPPGKIPKLALDTGPFVTSFIKAFVVVAGIFSLWQFLLGGLDYISASGDKAKIEQAGKRITMAITGLVVIAASFIIIALLSYFLFGDAGAILSPQLEVIQQKNSMLSIFVSLGKISGLGDFQGNINHGGSSAIVGNNITLLFTRIITVFTVIGGLAFLIYFILGAFKWITSGGDKGKLEIAQSQISNALIGLIVIIVSIFIIGLVGGILGFDILDPAKTLGI